ncbi:hypothetical protein Tco_0118981, partial [Tanacetum coccineum]
HIILSHTRPDAPSSGTPPLHLLSTDCRADRPEVTLPPQKRLGESSSAAARPTGGFGRTMDEMPVDMLGAPVTDDTELGQRMTEFITRVRQDTNEIYTRDRRAHARTARPMEAKAMMSREAWG